MVLYPRMKKQRSIYYSDDGHNPEYRKLKNKLKNKLINTSFFIDVNSAKFNSHQQAFYTCQKNLIAARILIGRNARKAAMQIVEDTFRKSVKFEFSDLSLELSRMLRQHYGINTRKKSLFDKYSKLVELYSEIAHAEDLAMQYYEHTSVLLNRDSKNAQEVIKLCDEYEIRLKPLIAKYDWYRLHFMYYTIILRRESLKGDQNQILKICDRAISFLEGKKFISEQFIGSFYYNRLMALIQLKRYGEGQVEANRCMSIFEEGSVRWYNAHHYCFLFSMHTEQYKKAHLIRDRVTSSKEFGRQYQNREETWHLHGAYLYYLNLRGYLNLSKNSPISNFRIRKFLNEVPVFSMDKSGYNIPILIIQILIQINQGKYDQLTDKIEAIEKYGTRYLRRDSNYRSNCFIKMLLQIPKQHFHRVAVERHTRSLVAKLRAVPLEKINQPFEIEIIPYEQLWKMALESLDR